MNNEIYLCLSNNTNQLYAGTDWQTVGPTDRVFSCLAYQMSITKSPQAAILRVTLDEPAAVSYLSQIALASADAGPQARLHIRGAHPAQGLTAMLEYSGEIILTSVVPHLPNMKSPVNAEFRTMVDLEMTFTAVLTIEDFFTGDSQSFDFSSPIQ
jgi:hypothetical protein